MTTYPVLTQGEDSKKFSVEFEDVAMGSTMEGGYVATRPRHTRTPRRTFNTGFTDISEADKITYETFIGTVRAGSDSFTWIHPTTAESLTVRFKLGTVPKFNYKGYGGNHRWDITSIALEEV